MAMNGEGWAGALLAAVGTAAVVDGIKGREIAGLQNALADAQVTIDRQRVAFASREAMLQRELKAAGEREAETARRAAADVAATNLRSAQIDASRSEVIRGRDRLQSEIETLRRDHATEIGRLGQAHTAELAKRDDVEAGLRKQIEDLTSKLAVSQPASPPPAADDA